ncbi:MAG: hypothetical protein ABI472_08760 [Ginsengibacter sp.]
MYAKIKDEDASYSPVQNTAGIFYTDVSPLLFHACFKQTYSHFIQKRIRNEFYELKGSINRMK